MCGLAGALRFEGSSFPITEDYLVRMRDVMEHRGPDGAGVWIDERRRVGLAHRRLSIIDLSDAALQPMPNEDKTLWVIFNGEIYNHAEIRSELERKGTHRWQTDHSDTEVILHAFEEWGIDCVHRFRGMFAIALWDTRREELWLIRDRIGVKPLYYSLHHGRLTFASEVKALLQDPEQERAVDEVALYHYLSFLIPPAPQTMFRGIQKLPCASWLRVDARGRLETRRYWDALENVEPLTDLSEEAIVERIMAELRTAVRLRKVSDVPVGVFLSGGVDSSTNLALFSEGEDQPVKTFSIGYDREYASYGNELAYARQMAGRVGAEHHERILSVDDLMAFLPRMIQLQDEPIADPVCVPVYYVSELARQHGVKVCQVGEGADELFWGYPSWKVMRSLQLADNLPVPRGAKTLGLRLLRAAGRDGGRPYEFLRRGAAGQPVFWGGAEAFTDVEKRRALGPDVLRRLGGFDSWEAIRPYWERFRANAWEASPLQWMTYLDLNLRLPELLLMRVDKMTMGVSLEGRVPFLDHKLVELVMGIPERMKVRHGRLKHLLKEGVRDLLPSEIVNRRKQGFGVPMNEWFNETIRGFARATLVEFSDETGYLNRAEVLRLIEHDRGPQTWYLLNLALWWKEYIAEGNPLRDRQAVGVH